MMRPRGSLAAALLIAALALAACTPATPTTSPAPTAAPAAKPTTAPAAAPTTAAATTQPAAAATQPAAPKPTAASQPAAASSGAYGPADVRSEAAAATIQGPEIKLGLITVTEGSPFASNGKRALEGARFAVQEINDAGGVGGVPIKLIETDTRGDVNATTNLVRRLGTEDNALGIVGPLLSGECAAGCPLANELKVPLVSPGSAQAGLMEKARPYAFRTVMPDDANSYQSIQAIIKRQNIKTAAIIRDEKEAIAKFMGETFWPKVFRENGVDIVENVTFTAGDASYAAQVTRIKAANPQAVALAAGSGDAARIALELKRQNVKTQMLGSGGLQSSGEDFIKAGGDAVEGAMTAAQFDPANPDPSVQALIKNYQAKTGNTDVTLNAAFTYDAIYIMADQIKRMGVTNDPANLAADRDKIKDGLAKLSNFNGMGGLTSLGPDGEVRRPTMIATVKGGQFVIEQVQ
jgi:branched-chain amino acid transport system substrate-binding protein